MNDSEQNELAASAGLPDWENMRVLQRGAERPRAASIPYADRESALANDPSRSPYYRLLNGEWKFHYAPSPLDAPERFYEESFDDEDWGTLPVPSNWQLHGFGTPLYSSSKYPFPVDPPHIPKSNPTGSYRRTFAVSHDWADRTVLLAFDGVDSAFHVWVNGREAGFGQGSHNRIEFDITALVRPGDNTLAVRVYQWSTGSYLEDQDKWRLSGIFRDVCLLAVPQVHMRDVRIRTRLDESYREGVLELAVAMRDRAGGGMTAHGRIEAELICDATGRTVRRADAEVPPMPTSCMIVREEPPETAASAGGAVRQANGAMTQAPRADSEAAVPQPTAEPDRETVVRMELPVASPELWTAETPSLYTLLLTLSDEAGRTLEVHRYTVGFRDVRVADGRLLVNGRPIVVRGVNRNEFDPDLGHVTTMEAMVRDVELMKRHNVNTVRCSHYPNDERWLELCSRYGLYVVDEADLETHGCVFLGDISRWIDNPDEKAACESRLSRDPAWKDAYLDRIERLVERDKNHPCVIVWSLGNESGYGSNHDAMAAWVREADPTRPIHYERAGDAPITDIVSSMYPSVDMLIEQGERAGEKRPYLMVEFGHAMGNALGNQKEYWDAVYRYPRLCGGLIWEWTDLSLRRRTEDGRSEYAYGGDFGDEPNSGHFCIDGLLFPDRTPKPALLEFKKAIEPVTVQPVDPERGLVRIGNRYDFVSLAHLAVRWLVYRDGIVLEQGELPPLSVPAGGEETVAIPYRAKPGGDGGEYWLHLSFTLREGTLWAPAGHEVAWADIPLAADRERAPSAESGPGEARLGRQMACEVRLPVNGPESLAPPESRPAPAAGDTFPALAHTDADTPGKPHRATPQPIVRADDLPPLTARENGRYLNVTGERFTMTFDLLHGTIASWNHDGVPLLTRGPSINLWRAPVDNDVRLAKQWREAGYEELGCFVRDAAAHTIAGGGAVRIRTEGVLGVKGLRPLFAWTQQHAIYGSGDVRIDTSLRPLKEELPPLPRLGLRFRVPERFGRFAWFGRGPHECYADRKESGKLGIYAGTVDEQFVPYIKPQENGSKADVRWAALTDAGGETGLLVASVESPFGQVGALRYSIEELGRAKHLSDLVPLADIEVCVDMRQSGLGNHSCGYAPPLPPYLIAPEPVRFAVVLKPFGGERFDPMKESRLLPPDLDR